MATEFWIPTLGQVAEAATGLGFPVALKVLSTEIAHKARVGGVRVNLRTRQEVIEAAAGIQSDVAAAIPAAQVDRFLVERMVSGAEAEFIIGIKRHAACLLYTSDAADERSSVDLGGRRIIKKKKKHEN